jgi:hypothetical protein
MAIKMKTRFIKTTTKLIMAFAFISLIHPKLHAQNEVAIGSATTKSNAILWLNGNGSQGLILPVVTNKTAVANPDQGMIVYDNSDNKVWYRNNSTWVEVGGGSSGGSNENLNLQLSGNQLSLRDGSTVLNTVTIAGGTQANGAFLVFQGGSWQFATLSGDVTGANGALTIANNAVNSAKIADASITGADIANNTITADKLAASGATVNQVLQWNGTNWIPVTLSTGGTVTTVTGTSPVTVTNPTTTPAISIANAGITTALIADNAITTAKIQDGTITGADIANTTVTADKLAQSSANNGQVLKWNGTAWAPAADDTGSGALPTLAAGQLVTSNGSTNIPVTMSGDATFTQTGALTIANNAVNSAKIADGSVTGADIAALTITSANIVDLSITANKLSASGATNNQVLQWNGSAWVPGTLAAGGSVTSIATGAGLTGGPITTTGTIAITAGGVDNTMLAANAVTTDKIADGTITGPDIANTTITANKLAQSAATPGQVLKWNGTNWLPAADDVGGGATPTLNPGQILIGDGTTNAAAALSGDATLAGGVLTIANNAITTAKINNNAVDATKLADNAVTTAKITTNAVDNTKMADNAVTTPKIADNAITSVKIADGEIGNADISNTAAIAVTKLAAGTESHVLTTVAGVPTWQASVTGVTTLDGLTDVTVTAPASGQILVNSGAGQFVNVAISGDATVANTGVLTIANNTVTTTKIADGAVTTLKVANNAITSAKIADGEIINADIAPTAAIAVTKLAAGTDNQVLTTVAGVPTWSAGSAGWNLTGNAGTDPALNFVGTTDAQPLRFATGVGSVERMRISETGNVGIGTATPSSPLHVASTGNRVNTIDGSNTIGTWSEIRNTSTGGQIFGMVSTGSANGEGAGKLLFTKNNLFGSNAGTIMAFDWATANVGIGTSAPAAKVDIIGTIKITDGTQAAGRVLTSDANGVATWQNASGNFSTLNAVPKGDGTTLVASNITDDGTTTSIISNSVGNTALVIRNQNGGGISGTLAGTKGGLVLASETGAGQVTGFETRTGGVGTGTTYTGLFASAENTGSSVNYGGQFRAEGSTLQNIAVVATADQNAGINYGLLATVGGTQNSDKYGLYINMLGNGTKYGVYAVGENTNYFSGNIGVGTITPGAKLDVIGKVKITDGTQAAGRVLTSDANGVASWTIPSGTTLITNTGTRNLFAGDLVSTAGTDNASYGYRAGAVNTGNYNVIIGTEAGVSKTTGDLSTIIGWWAGRAGTSHIGNTLVGAQAGELTSGNVNTFIGEKAGQNTSTGSENVFMGNSAGDTNTTGGRHTIIGNNADVGAAGLQNASAIGYRAFVNQSNSLVLGGVNGLNGVSVNTNVGIGTSTPNYLLHVNDPANTQSALQLTAGTATGTTTVDGLIISSNASAANILNRENTSLTLGTSGLTRVTIAGNGNVGIGTITPNASLHLGNVLGNRRLVLWESVNNDHEYYGFGVNGGEFRYQIPNNSGAQHRFYAATSATTSLLQMSIGQNGNVAIAGTLSKGSGTFKIDHPTDPENKFLYHSFVESPDMMNVYNGNVETDANGFATVELPGYFEALNREFRYQLTVLGQFAQAIVLKEIANNQFVIQTDKPGVKVSWQVTGVRKDPFAEKNRVVPEVEKSAEEKGKYLHPEAYGQPTQKRIGLENNFN